MTMQKTHAKKTKREIAEEKAYMVLSDIAFDYINIDGKWSLVAINLKNMEQEAFFMIRENDFMYVKGNMSKQNTYKTMLIVEKNKSILMEGASKCQNTQETR